MPRPTATIFEINGTEVDIKDEYARDQIDEIKEDVEIAAGIANKLYSSADAVKRYTFPAGNYNDRTLKLSIPNRGQNQVFKLTVEEANTVSISGIVAIYNDVIKFAEPVTVQTFRTGDKAGIWKSAAGNKFNIGIGGQEYPLVVTAESINGANVPDLELTLANTYPDESGYTKIGQFDYNAGIQMEQFEVPAGGSVRCETQGTGFGWWHDTSYQPGSGTNQIVYVNSSSTPQQVPIVENSAFLANWELLSGQYRVTSQIGIKNKTTGTRTIQWYHF